MIFEPNHRAHRTRLCDFPEFRDRPRTCKPRIKMRHKRRQCFVHELVRGVSGFRTFRRFQTVAIETRRPLPDATRRERRRN